jgi:CsoR family transcriptional regulator, copper-sensing transcriptional repressor
MSTSLSPHKVENKKAKMNTPKQHILPHDHTSELRRLSRIKGQVEGVERMIQEKRYCPEIIIQIKAIRSALRSLEANIVEGHMRHCVTAAIKSRDQVVVNEKLEEILLIIKGQG